MNNGVARAAPIALTVGISGHRDLCAPDGNTAGAREYWIGQFQQVLQHLAHAAPDKPLHRPRPLRVLTCLADGADQWMAEAAIGLRDRSPAMPVEVVAVLPMTQALYEQDFDPAGITRLRTLLEKVDANLTLPDYLPAGHDERNLALGTDGQYHPTRNLQYAKAGAFLARESLVLVTAWDGTELGDAGGTSQVVRFMLDGQMHWGTLDGKPLPAPPAYALRHIHDGGEQGCVIHLPARRLKQAGEPLALQQQNAGCGLAGKWRSATPMPAGAWLYFIHPSKYRLGDGPGIARCRQQQMENAILQIDAWNRLLPQAPTPGQQPGRDWALTGEDLHANPETYAQHGIDCSENSLAAHFHAADGLALHFQQKHFRWLATIFAFLLIGLIGYEWSRDLLGTDPGLALALASGLTGFALIALILRWVWLWRGWRRKYQEYRTLAEALRIAFFVPHLSAHEPQKDWLRQHQDKNTWIEMLVRYLTLLPTEPATAETLRRAKEWWISDQVSYFEKRLNENGARLGPWRTGLRQACRRQTRLGRGLLVFSITAWVALVMATAQGWVFSSLWASAIVALPTGLAAIIAEWAEVKGWAGDAERYETAITQFQSAALELEAHSELAAQISVCQSLAGHAIAEHLAWLALREQEDPLPT